MNKLIHVFKMRENSILSPEGHLTWTIDLSRPLSDEVYGFVDSDHVKDVVMDVEYPLPCCQIELGAELLDAEGNSLGVARYAEVIGALGTVVAAALPREPGYLDFARPIVAWGFFYGAVFSIDSYGVAKVL